MAGQGMDHPNFYYPDPEEPQNYPRSESEWEIQNHVTTSPPTLHPISPSSAVYFSSAQGYNVSTTVSPTEQYLPAGPAYGGYAPKRPAPRRPLQSESEYGLTPRTTFYDPNPGVSGYYTAPVSTAQSQHSYYQQTYDQNSAFSVWDSRLEPSQQYTGTVYSNYQPTSDTRGMAEQTLEQQPQPHQAFASNTNSTMGDYAGPFTHDAESSSKPIKKEKQSDTSKRQGRSSLSEPEQPRRKALPESRRHKGPNPDSVNKRPTTSRGSAKAKSSSMVTSPSGRSKVFPKEEDESEEEADGSSGNTSAAPTSRSRHNLVEQKYRHRLNAHFDQLLEVLPNTIGGISGQSTMSSPDFQSHDAGWSSAGFLPADRERKVSKAEVLDRARLYIQSLESNTRRLMADQEDLKARVEDYSRRNQEKHGKGGGK